MLCSFYSGLLNSISSSPWLDKTGVTTAAHCFSEQCQHSEMYVQHLWWGSE